MPATDFSSVPPAPATSSSSSSFSRSILSMRRSDHQIHSDSSSPSSAFSLDLDSFQRYVADRFSDLSSDSHPLLSLAWIRKLLDTFVLCHEEFDKILFNNRSLVSKASNDRLVNEFFDRSVKALDVCNAVRDGVELIREWNKILDIVLCALDGNYNNAGENSDRTSSHRLISEGQFRRAKKAVVDLSISMAIDDKVSTTGIAHRNCSFGRHNQGRDSHSNRPLGHFRSLSWSVSRSWSAAKQLLAIGNNLNPPRGSEIVASGGIAVVVYTMNCVLLFVMWALVAAIPCQDRGLHVHFMIPRQFPWAVGLLALHDKVLEESKRRERRNACGLLREIYQMENCARGIVELADSIQFPLTEEKEMEVREKVDELRQVYEGLNEGLDPLERQVREVFHRIVRSRTEGLDSLGKPNHSE